MITQRVPAFAASPIHPAGQVTRPAGAVPVAVLQPVGAATPIQQQALAIWNQLRMSCSTWQSLTRSSKLGYVQRVLSDIQAQQQALIARQHPNAWFQRTPSNTNLFQEGAPVDRSFFDFRAAPSIDALIAVIDVICAAQAQNVAPFAAKLRPAGQVHGRDPGSWPPTVIDGANLVRGSIGDCSHWRNLSNQNKVTIIRAWWDLGAGATPTVGWQPNYSPFASNGMDIAHPGWEQSYIAQADAYCLSAIGNATVAFAPASNPNNYSLGTLRSAAWWESDTGIAHFLGTHGPWLNTSLTCEQWNALPRGTPSLPSSPPPVAPRTKFDVLFGNVPSGYQAIAISRIDAYCAKRAIQAMNMPRPTSASLRPYRPVIRPSGQASLTVQFPLPPGFSAQGFNAQMQPTVAVGLNAQNQLVDMNGALVLDTSGRPITNPVATSAPSSIQPLPVKPPATTTTTSTTAHAPAAASSVSPMVAGGIGAVIGFIVGKMI